MRAESELRVLLADHAGASHAAIAALLGGLPGTRVVADVDDPAEIVPAIRASSPDVVVVDDRLLRGAEWTAGELAVRLIVIGVDNDPGYRRRAERLGAEAWVAKEAADIVLPVVLPRPRQVKQPG